MVLNPYDEKRHLISNSTDTLALGNYKIENDDDDDDVEMIDLIE